jgi:hypothetical protein
MAANPGERPFAITILRDKRSGPLRSTTRYQAEVALPS